MSLPAPLDSLYQEWRALTEAEGEAIATAAWHRVAEVQAAKTRLQPAIRKASASLAPSPDVRPEADAGDDPVRQMLSDLIDLERHNQAALDRQMAALRQDRRALELSARNLRRLQHSYASPNRSAWQRYS
jgi:hypothetical protein